MDTNKLIRGNTIQNQIRNLELVLNDFRVNGYDTFCVYRSVCGSNCSHYGTVIKDSDIVNKVKEIIKCRIDELKKEFEDL